MHFDRDAVFGNRLFLLHCLVWELVRQGEPGRTGRTRRTGRWLKRVPCHFAGVGFGERQQEEAHKHKHQGGEDNGLDAPAGSSLVVRASAPTSEGVCIPRLDPDGAWPCRGGGAGKRGAGVGRDPRKVPVPRPPTFEEAHEALTAARRFRRKGRGWGVRFGEALNKDNLLVLAGQAGLRWNLAIELKMLRRTAKSTV